MERIDPIVDTPDRLRRTIAAIIKALGILSAGVMTTEIDFGSTPLYSKTFIVTDANITTSHQIIATHSAAAATGRSQDENELEALICRCVAGSGQFTMYVDALPGPVVGKYKINYVFG